jgi:hypothetical protein
LGVAQVCPAGKRLYCNGRHCDLNGYEAIRFRGNKGDCRGCALRAQCLRYPDRTVERQVALFIGRAKGKPETYSAKMKRKIDSELGRHRYGRRLGIVEPVFANIRSTHRLSRFSHRGRRKVTTQWQLSVWFTTSATCSATARDEGFADEPIHSHRRSIRTTIVFSDHEPNTSFERRGFSTGSLGANVLRSRSKTILTG